MSKGWHYILGRGILGLFWFYRSSVYGFWTVVGLKTVPCLPCKSNPINLLSHYFSDNSTPDPHPVDVSCRVMTLDPCHPQVLVDSGLPRSPLPSPRVLRLLSPRDDGLSLSLPPPEGLQGEEDGRLRTSTRIPGLCWPPVSFRSDDLVMYVKSDTLILALPTPHPDLHIGFYRAFGFYRMTLRGCPGWPRLTIKWKPEHHLKFKHVIFDLYRVGQKSFCFEETL